MVRFGGFFKEKLQGLVPELLRTKALLFAYILHTFFYFSVNF